LLVMPAIGGVGGFAGGLEPFNLVDFDIGYLVPPGLI
jgi:hypothetical protein